jgi:hypothetical protein
MIEEILKIVGGAAVAGGMVAYLIKSLVSQLLSKDIEVYKAKIKFESDKEIEHLKAELLLKSQKHQISFQKLHEQRAQIVAELYSMINELATTAYMFGGSFVFGGHRTQLDRAEKTAEACREFSLYFRKNKIYFSEDLCNLIESLLGLIFNPSITFCDLKDYPEERQKFTTEFLKDLPAKEQLLNECRDAIEKEFRGLLGVTP